MAEVVNGDCVRVTTMLAIQPLRDLVEGDRGVLLEDVRGNRPPRDAPVLVDIGLQGSGGLGFLPSVPGIGHPLALHGVKR